jgi:hypothetical protein
MNILDAVKEKIAQYISVYIKLLKISFIEGASTVLGYFIFAIIGLFFFFCFIFFLGFGIVEIFVAIGLTKLSAYFITVSIYALLLIAVLLARKNIVRFFSGGLIRVLTENPKRNKENEDDDD